MAVYEVVKMMIFSSFILVSGAVIDFCDAIDLTDEGYEHVMTACQDKLAEWGNASESAATGRTNDSLVSTGIFVRGKWKQASTDVGSVVRPYFLADSEGKFDLFSMQAATLEDGSTPNIRNISAQLFLRGHKDIHRLTASLRAAGMYNSQLGEICFLMCHGSIVESFGRQNSSLNGTAPSPAVFRPPLYVNDGQNCSIRGLFTISDNAVMGRTNVEGRIESLSKNVSEAGYFTPMNMKGSMVKKVDQEALFRMDIIVRSLIFIAEIVLVIWQLVHSIRSAAGYFVSMLMILVQIAVLCVLAVRLIYVPLRLLSYRNFTYLVTSLSLVPYFIGLGIVLANVGFFWVIYRKRRIAKRMNLEERPKELLLAVVCMIIYAITGLVLWSLQNFETYLQVVWCWFLLPQLIANVFWDLRMKPLLSGYVIGVTVCRIFYLGFNALRPTIYGYDDLENFPQSWFWGTTCTMLIFASYALVQQRYGGRAFLPQKWFGYRQLPSSNQEHPFPASKEEDEMFTL